MIWPRGTGLGGQQGGIKARPNLIRPKKSKSQVVGNYRKGRQ